MSLFDVMYDVTMTDEIFRESKLQAVSPLVPNTDYQVYAVNLQRQVQFVKYEVSCIGSTECVTIDIIPHFPAGACLPGVVYYHGKQPNGVDKIINMCYNKTGT